MDQESGQPLYRLEIGGVVDRRTAEALRLEISRLARDIGIEVCGFSLESPPDQSH